MQLKRKSLHKLRLLKWNSQNWKPNPGPSKNEPQAISTSHTVSLFHALFYTKNTSTHEEKSIQSHIHITK